MAELDKQEKLVVIRNKEEEERLLERMALDFDALCSAVASQTQGKWRELDSPAPQDCLEQENGDFGGVFRMWEGEVVFGVLDDRRLALQSACCPCYRFGKNMRRAGLGNCFLQGTVHAILAAGVLLNFLAFIVTHRNCFLYSAVAFSVCLGAYLGFFRMQIKRQFNIRGNNDNLLDDCVYHLICPCCTLSQESRTLEMNNVQDGTWHGRGDICIGSNGEGSKAFFELHRSLPISIKIRSATA